MNYATVWSMADGHQELEHHVAADVASSLQSWAVMAFTDYRAVRTDLVCSEKLIHGDL